MLNRCISSLQQLALHTINSKNIQKRDDKNRAHQLHALSSMQENTHDKLAQTKQVHRHESMQATFKY